VSSFFQLAELFSAHFVASKKDRKTSIHLARIRQQRGEDLKGYVRRFNHEAVLIPDLQDGVAYAAFLNGLLPSRFKFSLAESKVTTPIEALGRVQSFIEATKICAGKESLLLDSKKRVVEDRNVQSDKRQKPTNKRGGGGSMQVLATYGWRLREAPCFDDLGPSEPRSTSEIETSTVSTMKTAAIQHQNTGN